MSEAVTAPEPSAPAPVQAPAAEPTQTAPEWLGRVPEELRSNPSLTKFQSEGDLAKSYVEIQKMVGADKVAAPNENWTDDEWSDFYDRVGRPGEPGAYSFDNIAVPEGLPVEDGLALTMIEAAHKAGLSQRQFDSMFNTFLGTQGGMMAEAMQATTNAPAATEQALREEWGTAAPENFKNLRRAYAWFGREALDEINVEGGGKLGDHPGFLRLLAAKGAEMAQHGTFGGDVKQNVGFGKTPQDAQSEIASLQNDEKFQRAYMDRDNPEHKFAVERMGALYEQAYPDDGIGGGLIDIKIGETGPLDRA